MVPFFVRHDSGSCDAFVLIFIYIAIRSWKAGETWLVARPLYVQFVISGETTQRCIEFVKRQKLVSLLAFRDFHYPEVEIPFSE